MKNHKNLFLKVITGLLFLTLLSACIPTITRPPTLIPTIRTRALTPTIFHSAVSTQTEIPSLTPTLDLWRNEECHKTLSIADSDVGSIWNYKGNIEGRGRVDMLLDFTQHNEIRGFLFDFGLVREYKVNGCVENRSFTMWLQDKDRVESVIQGEFPSTDPRDNYSSNNLGTDVIMGLLIERNHSESSAIYLHLSSGGGGTMDHRFEFEGVKDDTVILNNAKRFLDAVASDNQAAVLETLQFPVICEIKGERKKIETPDSFLSYYNAIFGGGFNERLAITFPNYIIFYGGNFGGIGLPVYGGGAISFNGKGKITGIYNQKEPIPTPTP